MNIKKCLAGLLAICFAFGAVGCQGGRISATDGSSSISIGDSTEATSGEESVEDTSSTEGESDDESSSSESITEIILDAKNVVDVVLTRPNAWNFLPEAFQEKNMAYAEDTFPVTDFTTNTQVSIMGERFIGAQMMLLYDGLLTMQSALQKVDVVFALGEALASVYQTFINDNPNNYFSFTTSLSGLNIKIQLDGTKSTLLAGNGLLNVELHADSKENTNSGRIQVTDDVALKYEMSDDSLIYAYQIGVGPAMRTVNLSFARNGNTVAGYLYEFTGVNGLGITTTAVFSSDEEYTKVVAKKRESDDLIVLGNEEVYNSQTGEFISCVVSETNKLMDFETYWFRLSDVSGFNSVKVVNESNKEQVYVNGSTNVFAPKNISIVNFSRRFDIEMKTVYYVKEVLEGTEKNYEIVKSNIPMLFAQTSTFEDLGDDIVEKNANDFTTTPTVASGIAEIALEDFETLKGLFDTIQTLTYESIVAYIGEKDTFFES
ncbi:MAG: hypothetical protein IJ996_05300 [Clostridia bacterium]|nr:hypothetical protein [Clostridia bacterium]